MSLISLRFLSAPMQVSGRPPDLSSSHSSSFPPLAAGFAPSRFISLVPRPLTKCPAAESVQTCNLPCLQTFGSRTISICIFFILMYCFLLDRYRQLPIIINKVFFHRLNGENVKTCIGELYKTDHLHLKLSTIHHLEQCDTNI